MSHTETQLDAINYEQVEPQEICAAKIDKATNIFF